MSPDEPLVHERTIREPLTYQRIEDGIREAMNRQEKLNTDFARHGDQLADAEVAWKLAEATTRSTLRMGMSPDGKRWTETGLNDETTKQTVETFSTYLVARARYNATKQALAVVQSRLDALRSLLVSHREIT